MSKTEYDFIIVGGGSAGATLARKLADSTPASILLIEGGPAYEDDPKVMYLKESLGLVGDPTYDYDYPLVPQERGNSLLRISRAKMLGGCSAHNDAWALRAPDADMDRWEAAGADGWNAATTGPYFEQVLTDMKVHPVTRTAELSQAWIAAAAERGWPEIDNTRGEYGQGISWVSLNEHEGLRYSTAMAYLFPLSDLAPNLTVQLETLVSRVLFDGTRAIGVETDRGSFYASKEIILSAGSIDTPKILMLSGVGPADHLAEVGIDVLIDSPGVGSNLQDHIETPVTWEATRPAGESINGLDLGMYASLGRSDEDFDTQITIGHFNYWLETEPFDELEHTELAFTFAPNVARPSSRGVVRLASSDWRDKPLVDPRYFTDEANEDEAKLIAGIKLAREFAQTEALRGWIVREIAPGPSVQTDEELGAYARRYSNTVYHPMCTAKMGSDDDPMAVVDGRLRVRGTEGLRVVDGSVMPEIVRVNPNITIVMIGARAADLIAEDHA
ncbi:GMC family oxidoreductase [Microbacterium sp.]|uniref:GMC family oxidoreductase n=1 Tax=Microbacterium sp. TaxID=51671 RepID=UPI0028114A18|nr:GMC family oxidoreductase [Microbacterium sp.]